MKIFNPPYTGYPWTRDGDNGRFEYVGQNTIKLIEEYFKNISNFIEKHSQTSPIFDDVYVSALKNNETLFTNIFSSIEEEAQIYLPKAMEKRKLAAGDHEYSSVKLGDVLYLIAGSQSVVGLWKKNELSEGWKDYFRLYFLNCRAGGS